MIKLRKLKLSDLEDYKYRKLPKHKYHSFNGPYYRKQSEEEVEELVKKLKVKLLKGEEIQEKSKIISNEKDEIIGEVSWYWKSEETNWLEIGILIFNDEFWNKGIGYLALKVWIKEVFKQREEIVRIGLTTWSGNYGMVKLAKKIGMKEEAKYKNARIVNGKYYDSVSYGILKEEWEKGS